MDEKTTELWDASLHSMHDEEFGDVSESGWCALFLDWYDGKSYILCQDNNGFVGIVEFHDAKTAGVEWEWRCECSSFN